jgi:hypothetical protein
VCKAEWAVGKKVRERESGKEKHAAIMVEILKEEAKCERQEHGLERRQRDLPGPHTEKVGHGVEEDDLRGREPQGEI